MGGVTEKSFVKRSEEFDRNGGGGFDVIQRLQAEGGSDKIASSQSKKIRAYKYSKRNQNQSKDDWSDRREYQIIFACGIVRFIGLEHRIEKEL